MSGPRRQVLGVTALRLVLALVWVHLVATAAPRTAVLAAAGQPGWFTARVVAPAPQLAAWAALLLAGAVGVLLLTGFATRTAAVGGAVLALALSWGITGGLGTAVWPAAVLVAAHLALLLVDGVGALAVDGVRRAGASPERLARSWAVGAGLLSGAVLWVALGERMWEQLGLVLDGGLALGVHGWGLSTGVLLGAAAAALLAGSLPRLSALCAVAAVAAGAGALVVAIGVLAAPSAAVAWFAALAVVAGACTSPLRGAGGAPGGG